MKLVQQIVVFILPLFFIAQVESGPISADKLFTSQVHTFVDMSPDGNFLLDYSWREDGSYYIEIIDIDDYHVVYSAPIDSSVSMRALNWLSDDFILMSYRSKGRDYSKIGRFDGKDVVYSSLKNTQIFIDIIDDATGEILVANTRSNGQVYQLVQGSASDFFNLKLERVREIWQQYGSYYGYTYDRRSKKILAFELDVESEKITIVSLPLTGGNWKTVGVIRLDDFSFSPVGFLNEHTMAVLSNKDTDTVVLQEFDIRTQEYGKILFQHANYDLTDAKLSLDGSVEFVSYNQYGVSVREYLEDSQNRLAKRFVKTFDGQEVYIIDKSLMEDRYVLYVRGSNQPGQYFLYRKSEDLIDQLFSNFPKLESTELMPTRRLEVVTVDGLNIEGFLTVPAKGTKNVKSLLVVPHGGPIGVNDSATFNPQSQYFASRGFSVLRVNFRGSFGFGKAFQKKGVGEFGRLIEADIAAVVDVVQKEYQFDSACALGASYGAYSSVMLAIKYPEFYKCVVGAFGVYDLPLLFNDSNLRVENTKSVENVVGAYDESLRDVSPVNLVKQLKAPIFLIAGYDDKIARFEHTNRFKYLLNMAEHSFETLFYSNTGHGHNRWVDDRLDAARSYFFILNSLGISVPLKNELTELELEAIANDYATVADGYYFNENLISDSDKAFENYILAAEYGNSRAQFNVASFYEGGVSVERSLADAISWYKRSSDNGYANATYRLADFQEKLVFSDNKLSALDRYIKSETQGHKFAYLKMAKRQCLAPKEDRNIDDCISLLKRETVSGQSRAVDVERRKVMAEILFSKQLSNEEASKFVAFINSYYSTDDNDLKCKVFSVSSFGRSVSSKDKGIEKDWVDDQVSGILAEKGATFKVQYSCDKSWGTTKNRAGVKVRWITLNVTDDNGVPIDQDVSLNVIYFQHVMSDVYELKHKSEFVAADWVVEIETLDGELIHREVFSTAGIEESELSKIEPE